MQTRPNSAAATLRGIGQEAIDSAAMLLQCGADRAADCVNLKISKLGGLTRAAEARDLGVGRFADDANVFEQ